MASKGSLRAQTDWIKAVNNSKYLASRHGGTAEQWKTMSTASMLGANISDSYAQWANANLTASSIQSRQAEISSRAAISTANIMQQGAKVQGAQQTAFVKAGVKLEGSAINVLTETANQAMEASKIKQLEADFEAGQLEVQRRMAETQAELAPLEFLVNAGSSYAMGQL